MGPSTKRRVKQRTPEYHRRYQRAYHQVRKIRIYQEQINALIKRKRAANFSWQESEIDDKIGVLNAKMAALQQALEREKFRPLRPSRGKA